jgi:hypothetical protein
VLVSYSRRLVRRATRSSSRPSGARAGIHDRRPVIMDPRNGVPATRASRECPREDDRGVLASFGQNRRSVRLAKMHPTIVILAERSESRDP